MNIRHTIASPTNPFNAMLYVQITFLMQENELSSAIDPLHIVGMQPIWGAKQTKFSLLGIEILLFCRPDWLHSHRRARGLYLKCYH